MKKLLTIGILTLLGIFSFGKSAHAGLIFKAPPSIGLISGLVGYWSFDGKDVAGNKAYDRSGQGNNGTMFQNGVAQNIKPTSGRIGQAGFFDGDGDAVDMQDILEQSIFTYSAWVYVDLKNTVDLASTFVAKLTETNAQQFDAVGDFHSWLGWLHGTNRIGLEVYDDTPFAFIARYYSGGLSLRRWYHVAATYNGGTTPAAITIYLDGVKADDVSDSSGTFVSVDNVPSLFSLGAYWDNFLSRYSFVTNGKIDDVRVYNRVLSHDEIKRLYRIGATLKLGSSQALNTNTLKTGLVGYWSFDGPDMAGNTSYDRSGQGNNGTLTNGPIRTEGKIGQALKFDGNDDYVQASNSSSLDITGKTISVSAWINTRNAGKTFQRIVMKASNLGENEGYFLQFSGTSKKIEFNISQDGASVVTEQGDTALADNTWYHITGVHDGSNVFVYINGVQDGAPSSATNNLVSNSDQPLRIGQVSNLDVDLGFDGLIDDVRVYNRALTPDEAKRLYRIGATLKLGSSQALNTDTLKTGLVGYWSFDGPDMAGNTSYDRSGQGNNGTLVNTSTSSVRTAGKIGQALDFDGADDEVNAGTANSLDNLGPMSVSAWIKPDSSGESSQGTIVAKADDAIDGGGGEWGLHINNAANGLKLLIAAGAPDDIYRISSDSAIRIGEWQHVAATWDDSSNGSGIHLYVNGIETSYQTTNNGGGQTNDNSPKFDHR